MNYSRLEASEQSWSCESAIYSAYMTHPQWVTARSTCFACTTQSKEPVKVLYQRCSPRLFMKIVDSNRLRSEHNSNIYPTLFPLRNKSRGATCLPLLMGFFGYQLGLFSKLLPPGCHQCDSLMMYQFPDVVIVQRQAAKVCTSKTNHSFTAQLISCSAIS